MNQHHHFGREYLHFHPVNSRCRGYFLKELQKLSCIHHNKKPFPQTIPPAHIAVCNDSRIIQLKFPELRSYAQPAYHLNWDEVSNSCCLSLIPMMQEVLICAEKCRRYCVRDLWLPKPCPL